MLVSELVATSLRFRSVCEEDLDLHVGLGFSFTGLVHVDLYENNKIICSQFLCMIVDSGCTLVKCCVIEISSS